VTTVRVWILAVTLGSFGTGMVAGMLIPEMVASEQAPEASFEDYLRQMVDRYDLDAAQQRQLRMVLVADERAEAEILRNAEWSELSEALNSERLRSKRRTEERIRAVLDDQQRALYDRDSRPEREK